MRDSLALVKLRRDRRLAKRITDGLYRKSAYLRQNHALTGQSLTCLTYLNPRNVPVQKFDASARIYGLPLSRPAAGFQISGLRVVQYPTCWHLPDQSIAMLEPEGLGLADSRLTM